MPRSTPSRLPSCRATISPTRNCTPGAHCPAEACHRLWQYLVHGGLDNAGELLAYAAHMLGRAEPWREPAPLLRAGLYWPGMLRPDLDMVRARWRSRRPVAALVFYRALMQASDLDVIDAMIDGLDAAGLNPLPIFTASLKDPIGAPLVRELLEQARSGRRPERNRLRRLEPRRVAADATRPAGMLRPPGGVLGRQRIGLARRHARPLGARPGDERRPARARRPGAQPGGRVQGAKAVRCRHREQRRRLRPGQGPGAVHRGAGGRLGAPLRHAGGRASGRDRARELPQPRRADRQWRRPRHAGKHHPAARGHARGRLSHRRAPRDRPDSGRDAAGGGHQRPLDARRSRRPGHAPS